MKKFNWFQWAIILSSVVLLVLLGISVIVAYKRPSGKTGIDVGNIQEMRKQQ